MVNKKRRFIRIIDLLNKMANGEELPKKIQYKNIEFKLYKSSPEKYHFDCEVCSYPLKNYYDDSNLNDEIEIIEEPKEEPKEELEELEEIEFAKAGDLIITIINELIKNQNYIIREMKANKKQ